MRPVDVNGEPGRLAVGPDGQPIAVLVLEVGAEGVRGIRVIGNPDKLGHLASGPAPSSGLS